jgi:hypothetical protein
MTRDPFNITIQNRVYFVHPDYDDFTEQPIFGIEAEKKEIGILLINNFGKWEWTEGGIATLPAEIIGRSIEA